MSEYCCTHLHSSVGSVRDSILRTEQAVIKAKELGMTSLAISDHGSQSNLYKHYNVCKKHDIKPILGFEAYFVFDEDQKDKNYHLCIYAKNNTGLQNLYKIGSSSYINHFYRRPRVPKELLFNNSEGLIVTSACMAGPFAQLILNDEKDKAVEEIRSFQGHFGDDFYLEVHKHGIPEEDIITEAYNDIGDSLNCKIIGATDVHYLNSEDKVIHNIFKQLAYGSVGKASDDGFDGTGYHLLNFEEYGKLFTKKNAEYSLEIADKCNVYIDNYEYHLPKFEHDSIDSYEHIKKLAYAGLKKLGKDTDSEYVNRIEEELRVIHLGGLEDYFLIVSDNINWCKENNILTGPGRGSSAGSLLCYTLGITNVDPILYGLMFGRMLNAGRLLEFDFGV